LLTSYGRDAAGEDLATFGGNGALLHGLGTLPPWLALGAACMFLSYNVVAYRELRRQGEGGEVLKVRWWFARGGNMKAMAGHERKGPAAFVYNLGRRDVFVLVWTLLAILDLLPVVLAFALVIAAASFVVAVGQVVARPPALR